MMRQMRENTKWIMLITVLAFAGLMVFEWGMDLSGRSSGQIAGGEVGRVNRESIGYEEFITAYRNIYQQQQQVIDGPISATMNRQIEDAAWEQLVMQRLIQQELRRRGLRVTETEIRQAARFAPPPEFLQSEMFMTNGEFDLTKYHQFLASPATDVQLLTQLESYYRELIPRSKLYHQATAGVFLADQELWRMYRDANETVTVRFISVDPAAIVADTEVTVTDAEVRAYYRAHPDEFRREATAAVRYVVLDRTPGPADTLAARTLAAALIEELRAGEDFADMARRESADRGSAQQGGELTIGRGQTVPAFEQAAFSQPLGHIGGPVLTQYGYHIIRVDGREDDIATVRHILLPIELSDEREDELYERADSLERLGERLPLADAAAAFGLTVRTGDLTPATPLLPGVGDADEGADWVFEEAAPGDVSPLFEAPAAFYMLELVSRQAAGTVPQQEAAPRIRAILLEEKRRARAQDRVREALRAGPAEASLARVAAAFATDIRDAGPFSRGDFVPGLGSMNAAIGAAFGLRRGQHSDALQADGLVHVVQVVARQDADRASWEAQRDEQRRRLTPGVAEQRWTQFLTALREDATIVDNRAAVLRGAGAPPSPLAGW